MLTKMLRGRMMKRWAMRDFLVGFFSDPLVTLVSICGYTERTCVLATTVATRGICWVLVGIYH